MPALASAGPASAATCWQRVLSDWRDGHIDGTYSPSCLRAAIVNMPEDLKIYGNAEDDITRLLNRIQANRLAARQRAVSTRPATTTSSPSKATAPSSGSRSLAGRKDKTRKTQVHRVAAAPKQQASAGGNGLPFRTLLLVLAAVSAVSVLAFASARGLRG